MVMDRRNLCVGLAVLASSFLLLAGVASARGGASPSVTSPGTCKVVSLPSFIAQGEFYNAATVGDVIEVSCDPYTYSAGASVTVTASQLYSRCGNDVSWYLPNENGDDRVEYGRSVTLKLDVDGNANVGLIAGPKCMVGESLITVDEDEAPYETYTTSFQVLPAVNTPEGLTVMPKEQVEDQESSGVITIAEAEFSKASEKDVRIGAGQLYSRCQNGDHLNIISEDRSKHWSVSEETDAIELDNNGNGFVLLEGTDSCAEGTSLIEADLESSPFSTQTDTFTVLPPQVR
jgi:hypothetical protein